MLFLLGYNLKIVIKGEGGLTFGGGSGGSLLRGNFCRWEGRMSKLLGGGGREGGSPSGEN